MQKEIYCQHFKSLKLAKTIDLSESSPCRYCMLSSNYLWMCLVKNCGVMVCERNSQEHMKLHLEQYRNKKAFHSIFINILTARIVCIHCQLEILDLDQINNAKQASTLPDPYPLRLKVLPGLAELEKQKNKIMGQLENSEGHRRISKGLTGLFSNKYTHTINSALQFLIQFQYFRQLVLEVKPASREMEALQKIFKQAEDADLRAIHTDELTNLLFHDKPNLLGYGRKDPFEHILAFMTKLHQHIKHYSLQKQDEEFDEWDFLGRPNLSHFVNLNCPLFDAISFTLSFNYECEKCKYEQAAKGHYNFLKVNFPKKKRKLKEVEKELADHNYSSPVKNRRKSLMDIFKTEEECPFTLAELIIEFLKHPFHKDKNCPTCKEKLNKKKIHFSQLPDYLIVQVNRMGNDGNSIDHTKLEFSLEDMDLGPFTDNKDASILYRLESMVALENGCLFPVVARSNFNKQAYIFKGQLINLLRTQKNSPNPYIFCFKKVTSEIQQQHFVDSFNNVRSSVDTAAQMDSSATMLPLPDFWLTQLKFGIGRPLLHQLVCRHHRRKPNVHSKMRSQQLVPIEVYEYLTEEYTGSVFKNQECGQCEKMAGLLQQRKKKEKEKIIEYQKMKSSCHCMISNTWLRKWMDFLYKKGQFCYLYQGNPFPGPIDNKVLLDGQKCKANLQKNVDYKVVSIFIWRLLKDIYGGGPEIRYKWNKSQVTGEEQRIMKEVKIIAKDIKQIYQQQMPESPKKSMIIERTTSYVESVRESDQQDIKDDEPEIPDKQ